MLCLAQSHRISLERARCSFTRFLDWQIYKKYIYIEVPPVCISSVHLQCARSLSLQLSILYSTWHPRFWKGIEDCPVFFYFIWVSVQSTSSHRVVWQAAQDIFATSAAQYPLHWKACFANPLLCHSIGSSVGGHAHHHSVVERWECRAGCGARHDYPGLATIRGGWERIGTFSENILLNNCNS